ncbi:DNA-binding response regulator, partial [Campylobacter coli]
MAARILLLEDDLSLSEIIEEFLIDEGYEVY